MAEAGKPIVSVAGLRGIVGESFTPEVLFPYLVAFAAMLEKKRVVVGGDSRPSRIWAQPFVEGILRARGVDVVSVGLAPTPTVGMMVREFGAGGGIAITASHNPIQWNGLKFFHEAGEFLTPSHHHRISELIEKLDEIAGPDGVGRLEERDDAIDIHLDRVKKVLPPPDTPKKRLRVVLDCCNGAGSEIAPRLLAAYGVDAEVIFSNPTNPFPHEAEPLPENLLLLREEVVKRKADFGAAYDPDADRLALVDESGRAIGEERTLLLGTDTFLRLRPSDKPVTVNLSTSQAIDRLAAERGFAVRRTKIGEAHVLAGMREAGSEIGGEGNGGVILPAIHPGRDATTALALIVIGLQQRGGTLSEWNRLVPDFAMIKDKIALGDVSVEETLARAKKEFADANHLDTTDGLKAVYDDQWVHLRPSGTEPILRIFVEGPDEDSARRLLERARGLL